MRWRLVSEPSGAVIGCLFRFFAGVSVSGDEVVATGNEGFGRAAILQTEDFRDNDIVDL